jgi:GNAT superfamily N-acetyltransferase
MFLGAFLDGQMVGMIMGSHDSRKGWLNRLAVIPEHQGKGIAQALVEEMERRLKDRGFHIIAVLIEDGHDASMGLFKKAGYVIYDGITYMTKRENPDV